MNSSIEISEAAKLAAKLIDRTREGKLSWEAARRSTETLSPPASFTTTLEGSLRATVSSGDEGGVVYEQQEKLSFSLVEFDPSEGTFAASIIGTSEPDKVVLSVSVERDPSFGYDTAEEKYLARLLTDLHGLARRSALKVAGSVEKALSYLDKIAG